MQRKRIQYASWRFENLGRIQEKQIKIVFIRKKLSEASTESTTEVLLVLVLVTSLRQCLKIYFFVL